MSRDLRLRPMFRSTFFQKIALIARMCKANNLLCSKSRNWPELMIAPIGHTKNTIGLDWPCQIQTDKSGRGHRLISANFHSVKFSLSRQSNDKQLSKQQIKHECCIRNRVCDLPSYQKEEAVDNCRYGIASFSCL